MPRKAITGRFRPASSSDFKTYAKHLSWLTGLPVQTAQTVLATIYGYGSRRELDAELTEKAAPGPFEDEAQPLLYSIGTVAGPFQASAKRVSTLIEAALSKAGLVCDQYRKELATKLGLFTSPQQHQRCFEFVKSQVHLTEALQLPVNAARVLEGLHCKWIFDKKTLATFEYVRRDSEDDFTITSTVFDVDAQLAGLRNYAAAIVGRYASVPFPSHENQLDEAVLSFMGFYFGGEVRAHDMDIGVYEENLTDAWQEFVVEFLPESGLASDASGNDANVGAADASNKSWDESALGKFILSPSIELAAKCEFLADIPDPVSLAQTFAREYARRTLSSGCRYPEDVTVVLHKSEPLPKQISWPESQHHLEMFVQAKPTNAAESQWGDFITLWDYSATVCVADTRSRLFTPIALLTGILIVPFRESEDFGIEPIGDDGFADHMDAHSAWMNDVWRELAFGYIPNKGVGGVSELVEEKGDPGFLVIDVELAQEYRGKDLVPSLLRMLVSAFNDRGTTSLFSAYSLDLRADGGSANEVRDFDFEDDDVGRAGVYRGISLASPIVLVFPVSGSEPGPDSGSPADILLAYTNARVQPSKKDAKAEAFKAKLTPHFRSMAEKVGLDVVVYDPWEHPIT